MSALIDENGNYVVKLKYSTLKTAEHDQPVTELTFSEPKAKHLSAIRKMAMRLKSKQGDLDEFDLLLIGISILASPKISFMEAGELDITDLEEVGNTLNSFRGFKSFTANRPA